MAKSATAQVQAPAPIATKKPAFVIVGSKLPMNLELQLCKAQKATTVGRHGSTEETIYTKFGVVYVIRGTAYPAGTPPDGFPEKPRMANGYAMTNGIPEDFWRAWVEQNAETDMVRNQLLIAERDPTSLRDVSADLKDVKSGLDPLDPKGDKRSPKPLNARAIEPIKTAEGGPMRGPALSSAEPTEVEFADV